MIGKIDSSHLTGERLQMPEADVIFYRAFFLQSESDRYFKLLMKTVRWQKLTIGTPAGRLPLPRLVAWYGDSGVEYSYSGIKHHSLAWTPLLLEIKSRIEPIIKTKFNSVLLNFYRSGNDSVGWHSDNEPELGREPLIASVSFGATRKFQFRHKAKHGLKANIELPHGSLLVMKGSTQLYWLHSIPKTKKPVGARVNLTFRYTSPKEIK